MCRSAEGFGPMLEQGWFRRADTSRTVSCTQSLPRQNRLDWLLFVGSESLSEPHTSGERHESVQAKAHMFVDCEIRVLQGLALQSCGR